MIPFPYQKLLGNYNEAKSKASSAHWWFYCPFHSGDNEASFSVNKGGRWPLYYRCWACGVNGSPEKYAEENTQNPKLIKIPEVVEEKKKVEVDWEDALQVGGTKTVHLKVAPLFGIDTNTMLKFDYGYFNNNLLVPMYNQDGKICGIQEHFWKGGKHIKKCMKYSKHGVFKPNIKFDFKEPLFICEGFSDTAVMIDMGFQAIGKYNALHKLNKKIIDQIKRFKRVFIISDNDECGRKGTWELAGKLQPGGNLEVVKGIYPLPSVKDIREMYLKEGKGETKTWILEQIK